MVVYFVIFIILALLTLLDIGKVDARVKKFCFNAALLGLVVFSGLRWRTGVDWPPYFHFFEDFDFRNEVFFTIFERGYVALTVAVKWLWDSYTVFLIIFGYLVIFLRGKFIKQHVSSVFIALLLFWGNNLAEVFPIRQSLAISICLLSIPFIQKRKFWHHLAIVVLAMQFHSTAIIWTFAYFVYKANWSVGFKIRLLTACIFIGLAGFLDVLFSFLESVEVFGRLSTKAEEYSQMGSETTFGANKFVVLGVGIAKRALMLPVLFYFEKRFNDKVFSGFSNLFVFGNALYFLVIEFLAIQRVATYFYAAEVILLTMIVQRVDGAANKRLWYFILILYAFIKMMFILNASADYILPYYWINSPSFERVWN